MFQDLPNERERNALRTTAVSLVGLTFLLSVCLLGVWKNKDVRASVAAHTVVQATPSPQIVRAPVMVKDKAIPVGYVPLSRIFADLRQQLLQSEKVEVRASAANCLGIMRQSENSVQNVEFLEAHALSSLYHAYKHEASSFVRQAIVLAAAEYNGSIAEKLLAEARLDEDAAIREAALLAQVRRQKRLLQMPKQ